MDLTGKAATIDVSHEVLARLFPPTQTYREGRWTLLGEVKGETPGVGLWLELFGVVTPEPESKKIHSPLKNASLIRWEWIETMTVFAEKPKSGMGIRPRLAQQ